MAQITLHSHIAYAGETTDAENSKHVGSLLAVSYHDIGQEVFISVMLLVFACN